MRGWKKVCEVRYAWFEIAVDGQICAVENRCGKYG